MKLLKYFQPFSMVYLTTKLGQVQPKNIDENCACESLIEHRVNYRLYQLGLWTPEDDCADGEKLVIDEKSIRCEKAKFVLYRHNENISGFREMTEFEIASRRDEIGEYYEGNGGTFVAYKDVIDIDDCFYCTRDHKIWWHGNNKIRSANADSTYAQCGDSQTSVCPYNSSYGKCLKKAKEFEEVFFGIHGNYCYDTDKYYSLFIDSSIPEIKPDYNQHLKKICKPYDTSMKCKNKDVKSPFKVYLHDAYIRKYSQLHSQDLTWELKDYMWDAYVYGRGFEKYKDQIDIHHYNWCTSDSRILKEDSSALESAIYDSKNYNGWSDSNAFCTRSGICYSENKNFQSIYTADEPSSCKKNQKHYAIFLSNDIEW